MPIMIAGSKKQYTLLYNLLVSKGYREYLESNEVKEKVKSKHS